MTLTILDVPQGSDEWHDARRGLVTASVVGQLITPTLQVADNEASKTLTRLLAAERITGYTDPTFQSADMFRGVLEEPRAREAYSERHAEAVECGFMRYEQKGITLGYSPDGLVSEDGLIEIKAPRQKEHLRTIRDNKVPTHNYMAQMQAGLLVSGRAWCDFVSWCPPMPLWRIRVWPDEDWFDAIHCALVRFEFNAAQIVADYKQATEGLAPTERLPEFEEIKI